MRLCSFVVKGERPERQRAGMVRDSRVFDLRGGWTMVRLLESGNDLGSVEAQGPGFDLEDVRLLAPVPRPGKIIATIVNTRAMLGGKGVALDRPRLDMKAPSAAIGPGETILAPPAGIRPEVELAAVVGKKMKGVTKEEAEKCLAGYTVLNDVTAPADSREDAYEAYRRDRATGKIARSTMRGPLFRSKNHDTFCPMGPWLVTPDGAADWSRVRMTTKFDGVLVQDGTAAEYIFGPARIASYVSEFLTLEPGDVVSCGSVGWTPAALGALDPTEYLLPLREGLLELEIEGIGKLANPVSIAPGRR